MGVHVVDGAAYCVVSVGLCSIRVFFVQTQAGRGAGRVCQKLDKSCIGI
jgi:hypothetical protein